MSTTLSRTTCLISHSNSLTELDFIVQNIEYSFRNEDIRLHGVLSPFSKSYEYTAVALEKIAKKLQSVYGLSSLIVDISMSGDQGVLTQIQKHNLKRSDDGVFHDENKVLNYLLLNTSLEEESKNILDDLFFWKTIEESKKYFDILFLLPSVKNNAIIEQLDINAQVQWLFLEKKNAAKAFKNLTKQTHFQVPFLGVVTV